MNREGWSSCGGAVAVAFVVLVVRKVFGWIKSGMVLVLCWCHGGGKGFWVLNNGRESKDAHRTVVVSPKSIRNDCISSSRERIFRNPPPQPTLPEQDGHHQASTTVWKISLLWGVKAIKTKEALHSHTSMSKQSDKELRRKVFAHLDFDFS